MRENADRGKLLDVRFGRIVVIALVASVAAGCTSSSSDPDPTPSDTVTVVTTPPTSSPTPSPTPTLSANATAALRAYLHYIAASNRAYRSPGKANQAELHRYSVDPAYGVLNGNLISFALAGIAFRGEPPRSRVITVSDQPQAKPWPSVTVTDCPTSAPTWLPFEVKAHKPAKLRPGDAPPPYLLTATVIFYKGRWAVSQTRTDRTRTCNP